MTLAIRRFLSVSPMFHPCYGHFAEPAAGVLKPVQFSPVRFSQAIPAQSGSAQFGPVRFGTAALSRYCETRD